MSFTVTETIHHGDYRNVRTAPFVGLEPFRAFVAESPYAPSSEARDSLGLPLRTSPLDRVVENAYHALSLGRTYEHGWITWEVSR